MHGSACGGVRVAPSGSDGATARVRAPAVRSHLDVVCPIRASVPALSACFFGVRFCGVLISPLRLLAGLLLFFMNLGVNNGSSTLQ